MPHTNPTEDYEAPVIDQEGDQHTLFESVQGRKREWLRRTLKVSGAEVIYGATDTEIVFWKEIVNLRKALQGAAPDAEDAL